MPSLVAFFHKHYEIQERKFRATNQMKKNIRRIQTKATNPAWHHCYKCKEYFEEKHLVHDPVSKADFCTNCMNAINILRDV